jgi:hypothetical protein
MSQLCVHTSPKCQHGLLYLLVTYRSWGISPLKSLICSNAFTLIFQIKYFKYVLDYDCAKSSLNSSLLQPCLLKNLWLGITLKSFIDTWGYNQEKQVHLHSQHDPEIPSLSPPWPPSQWPFFLSLPVLSVRSACSSAHLRWIHFSDFAPVMWSSKHSMWCHLSCREYTHLFLKLPASIITSKKNLFWFQLTCGPLTTISLASYAHLTILVLKGYVAVCLLLCWTVTSSESKHSSQLFSESLPEHLRYKV